MIEHVVQNSADSMRSKCRFGKTVEHRLKLGNRADTNFVPVKKITGQPIKRCLSGLKGRVLQAGRKDHRLKHGKLLVPGQTSELFFQLLEQSGNDLLPVGG